MEICVTHLQGVASAAEQGGEKVVALLHVAVYADVLHQPVINTL